MWQIERFFERALGEIENVEVRYTMALAVCPLAREQGNMEPLRGLTESLHRGLRCHFTGACDVYQKKSLITQAEAGLAATAKKCRFGFEVLIQFPSSRVTYQL